MSDELETDGTRHRTIVYVKGLPAPIEVDETVDAIKRLMQRGPKRAGAGSHANTELVEIGEIPTYGGPARPIWLRPIDIAAVRPE